MKPKRVLAATTVVLGLGVLAWGAVSLPGALDDDLVSSDRSLRVTFEDSRAPTVSEFWYVVFASTEMPRDAFTLGPYRGETPVASASLANTPYLITAYTRAKEAGQRRNVCTLTLVVREAPLIHRLRYRVDDDGCELARR
jgi:hypothetical protein